ncbi:MAG: hypothetical protein V4454_12755 [Pseudomonadota bacterium]
MKVSLAILLFFSIAESAFAQVSVERLPLGSGTPGTSGNEMAVQWDADSYHVPQYMPGYPTAATIFPRTLNVYCLQTSNGVNCRGYNWLPEMGRAEYLLIKPILVKEFPNGN